jgi:hypothetical protein
MFRSSNIYKIGSRKSSLQDRGHEDSFPPSKKSRVGDNCTSRQPRVEDDVWGEDLDANTVEECFILASQALSQVRIINGVMQLGGPWPKCGSSWFFQAMCVIAP